MQMARTITALVGVLVLIGCANVTTTRLVITKGTARIYLSSGKDVSWERAEYCPSNGTFTIVGYKSSANPDVVSAQGWREEKATENLGHIIGTAIRSSGGVP